MALTVLVPPLLMPRAGMLPLRFRLMANGVETRLFGYPSYREDIPANAARLATYLRRLDAQQIDIVTFSMGGILLRWAYSRENDLPRLRRVVMIGPPNQGAQSANIGDKWLGPLFPWVFGKPARQLRPGDEGLAAGAGLLPEGTQLGIIAGGTGKEKGINPLLDGDNDRIVRVEEAKLEGMTDFVLLKGLAHGPLIFSPRTGRYTVEFLHKGQFPKASSGITSRLPHSHATRLARMP